MRFEPGSRYEYSNNGFILLGVLIEAVTGQSYYDYVREHVFAPAGMTATDSVPEAEVVPGCASGTCIAKFVGIGHRPAPMSGHRCRRRRLDRR